MSDRHWVLVEPFGPNDFTVYDNRDERQAVAHYQRTLHEGKQAMFVTSTGRVADLRATLRARRREYVAALSQEVA